MHGEHFAATRPHRPAVADAFVAPVNRRAPRLSRPHRIDCGPGRVGHAASRRASHGDRQPRGPAGQLDIAVEVQSGDHRGDEDVGGLTQRGVALCRGQRPHFALCADGAGHIQRRHDAQLGHRHTGGVPDDLPVAGPVLALRAERIDGNQIRCGACLLGAVGGHRQYTPSMTASPSKVADGRDLAKRVANLAVGPRESDRGIAFKVIRYEHSLADVVHHDLAAFAVWHFVAGDRINHPEHDIRRPRIESERFDVGCPGDGLGQNHGAAVRHCDPCIREDLAK